MWPFLPPVIAAIIAQILKLVAEVRRGTFSWHALKDYGGMPSAHSAFVAGLATELYITDGPWSGVFAVGIVLALLTIRDATGYRQQLSQHARLLNTLASREQAGLSPLPALKEKIGHRPIEACVGAVVGIAVVLLLNLWY